MYGSTAGCNFHSSSVPNRPCCESSLTCSGKMKARLSTFSRPSCLPKAPVRAPRPSRVVAAIPKASPSARLTAYEIVRGAAVMLTPQTLLQSSNTTVHRKSNTSSSPTPSPQESAANPYALPFPLQLLIVRLNLATALAMMMFMFVMYRLLGDGV